MYARLYDYTEQYFNEITMCTYYYNKKLELLEYKIHFSCSSGSKMIYYFLIKVRGITYFLFN